MTEEGLSGKINSLLSVTTSPVMTFNSAMADIVSLIDQSSNVLVSKSDPVLFGNSMTLRLVTTDSQAFAAKINTKRTHTE